MRISMIYKSTHIIALIGGLFFVGALAVFVIFFRYVEQQKVSFQEIRTTLDKVEKNRDALSALVQTLENTKDARASLSNRVLTDESVVDFLTLIETLGREQGVSLTTDAITVLPINSAFETIVMNVSAVGTYTRLIDTLTLFENLPYQVSIANVHFTQIEGNDTWKTQYDIQVTKFKKI